MKILQKILEEKYLNQWWGHKPRDLPLASNLTSLIGFVAATDVALHFWEHSIGVKYSNMSSLCK